MATTGTASIDFGAFPGASDASVVITGQAGILSSSLVEAWIFPADTADHSADEHIIDTIKVVAHTIVPGTGFTITGVNTNQINEPLEYVQPVRFSAASIAPRAGGIFPSEGGLGTRLYGVFNVAWVWN